MKMKTVFNLSFTLGFFFVY